VDADNHASLAEQIAEVERECAMRERVYGNWVVSGRMKLADSQRQIRRMRAVLATLKRLQAEEQAQQPELL
jgi:hypothetical protein